MMVSRGFAWFLLAQETTLRTWLPIGVEDFRGLLASGLEKDMDYAWHSPSFASME